MDRQHQLQTGVLFIGWIATAACAGGVPSGPAALTLTGAPQVEVRLLQPPRLSGSGVVPGVESTEAFLSLSPAEERRAKDALTKLFAQARWVFLPDGSFRFIPSKAADVRDDLYPLTGTYHRSNGTIEFRASRRSPLGPTASLDGVIRETKAGGLLDAVHAVAGNQVRMASFYQELSSLGNAEEEPGRIGGVPAPAIFSITLSGQVDGEALPPRTADLRILRPEAGNAASVTVQLDTVGAIDAGTLNWWSPTKGAARHRLSVEGGRVSVEVEGAGGDALSPTWWAPDREAPIATLSTPHAADRGRLRFSVQGDEVTGEIEAVGASNLDPAHREKTYHARFQGRRRDPADASSPAIPVGDAAPSGETAGLAPGPLELAGHFVLEDGTGKGEGNLTLARDGSLLRGTLETAGRRRSYTGHEESGRVDLNRDDGSTAFALRSVADGEFLVGLTKEADAKRPRAVVARRLLTATQAGEAAVAADDADELRRQGMDLALAGRCGVARAPLERSLSIYRQQADATDGKTYKPLILTQLEQVLMLLAACDLRQEDYAAYLDDLRQGAKLLPALRAAEVAQPLLPWRTTPPVGSGAGEKQGNISDSAIQAANRLAQQPDLLWARAVKDPTKVDLLEKLQSFFGELVLVLLEANQKSTALVVSETARSRALLDLLAARKEVKAGFSMHSTAADKSLPSPTSVAPLSLEELLDIVRRRGSTTIEYFLTEETLAIWVISPGGAIDAVTVPLTEHFPANGAAPRVALSKAIDELHELLDSKPTSSATAAGASGRTRTAELLRQLHGLLIGSIPVRLLPSSAEEPLTIIPHAELLGVPFAALRDASGRYFIESHTLVYGPSLAVLKYSREDREHLRHRGPRLLALVNPRPMPIAEDGKRLNDLGELEGDFPMIAGFYPEAGRRVLVGKEASKAALFAHAKEASELCLVTHAKFLDKPSDPLDSYIALAAGATPEDGYLRVPEAFRLELQAELVLLWACETGRGRFSGDGVQGLSRAFIWAGSPNLMLSLWSVAPKASAMQMYGFHQLWRQKGHSLAQALRLAQLEQMELYRDQPGVWAAFVLYGEGN